jgi:Leucine-rich repeat (LRR) protein
MKYKIVKILLAILLGILPMTSVVNIHADNQSIEVHSFKEKPISEVFPDENLARVVARHLNNNDDISFIVTAEMLESVQFLNAGERGIQTLEGMEHLKNLAAFVAPYNQISDVSPLSNLTKLEFLNLKNNLVTDITKLTGLIKLLHLDIEGNKIADIRILSNMSSLLNLNLSNNKISDISVLQELTALQFLDLKNNQISIVESLRDLENLTVLELSNNQISDISSLRKIPGNIVSVLDQTILLPKVAVGEPTKFTLLDREGVVPSYSFTVGTGQYDAAEGGLVWSTIGENRMVWSSPNFNGEVIQNVIQTATIYTINDIFPDVELAKNIAMVLHRNEDITVPVTAEELSKISVLFIKEGNIKDLQGMEYLINMVYLSIPKNQISDLTPLAKLINLRYIVLDNNQIEDISVLSELKDLRHLDLGYNKITDVKPIEKSLELNYLVLDNNHINDISFLSNVYEELTTFSAINQTIHLSQVAAAVRTNLPLLNQNKMAPEVTFVEGRGYHIDGQLTWTTAGQNTLEWSGPDSFSGTAVQNVIPGAPLKFSDMFPDENLAKIVAMLATEKDDISAIVDTKQLDRIITMNIVEQNIQYIYGVENLTNLMVLICNDNEISDLGPLSSLNHLSFLYLRNNKVKSIKPLENLTNLTYLSFGHNEITDISPLLGLRNLTHIFFQDNLISDVRGLENLTNLQQINLSDNNISDVSKFGNYSRLQYLNLDNNHISDISAINNMYKVAWATFTAQNQTINLPEATVASITKLTLLNEHGIRPEVTAIVGTGAYTEGGVIWFTVGDNVMTWKDTNFSGTIYQTVR